MGWRVTVGRGRRAAGTVRPLLTLVGQGRRWLGEPVDAAGRPLVSTRLPAPRVTAGRCGGFRSASPQYDGRTRASSHALTAGPSPAAAIPARTRWLDRWASNGQAGRADSERARAGHRRAISESDWDTRSARRCHRGPHRPAGAQRRNIADLGRPDRSPRSIVTNAGPLAADLLTLEAAAGRLQGHVAAGLAERLTVADDRSAPSACAVRTPLAAVRVTGRSTCVSDRRGGRRESGSWPAPRATGPRAGRQRDRLVPQPFGPILPRCVCAAPTKTEVSTARRHTLRRGVKRQGRAATARRA